MAEILLSDCKKQTKKCHYIWLPSVVIATPRSGKNAPDRRQLKMLILSTNIDKKIVAICSQTGDKWQLITMFLAIFDPRSSIVKSVFDCHLSGV